MADRSQACGGNLLTFEVYIRKNRNQGNIELIIFIFPKFSRVPISVTNMFKQITVERVHSGNAHPLQLTHFLVCRMN